MHGLVSRAITPALAFPATPSPRAIISLVRSAQAIRGRLEGSLTMPASRDLRRFSLLVEHACGLDHCVHAAAHVCGGCRQPYCPEHWLRLAIRRDPDGRAGMIEGCVRCLAVAGSALARRSRLLEWQHLGAR
jgi:hypothetical protein